MNSKTVIRFISLILIFCWVSLFAQEAKKGVGVKDLSDDHSIPYEDFVRYLKNHGKAPTDYVIDKLRQHDIVMIGEDHWIKCHPQFISQTIKAVHANGNQVGLDWLAFEFGNYIDQPLADEFIESSRYRENLVVKILRNSANTWGWPYREYVDVFKTVWEENNNHPNNKPIKILLTDNPYRLRKIYNRNDFCCITKQDIQLFTQRDRYMAWILEQKVIANDQKAIYYCGGKHSSYLAREYYLNTKTGDCLRYLPAGLLLNILYPKLIFCIQLYGANKDRNYYPSTNPEEWDRYWDGKMDEIFRRNDNKPVGFDITEPPFANIRDGDFFMFWERENRENFKKNFPKCVEKIGNIADRSLSDSWDGIIFLKPLEEYEGVELMEEFFTEEFMAEICKRFKKVITKKALVNYIYKRRPILGEYRKK